MTDGLSAVVIVGGGIGGIATATALRQNGYDGELTLVDAGEFPYDRPPLSKAYLGGEQAREQIALQSPQWYNDHAVRLIPGTKVAALLPAERAVELATGTTLTADRVVLATGGHAAVPPVPGANLGHVLRTIEDADRLRSVLQPGAHLIVAGAGLIGAEVASTARALRVAVTLIDPEPWPLSDAFGPEIARWLHELHGVHGVVTARGSLSSIVTSAQGVVVMVGQGGSVVGDAVLLATGMRPDTALAVECGLEVDDGVIVDAGQVTSNPAVLAVGDSSRHRVDGVLQSRTEHWEAAQLDGERAAATLLGMLPPAPTAPWFWSDRYGHHVEAVGTMTDASQRIMRGTPGEGPFSSWGLRDGHVVAAIAVDDANAVRAARRLIDRRVRVTADDLADPNTELRALLWR